MIRINLIPHRTEFRQQQILEHIITAVFAVLIALLLVVSLDIWKTQDLTSAKEEKQVLQEKNRVLSKKIGELRNLDNLRKDVEGKLEIVDSLQSGRFSALEALSGIAKLIPDNVWLDQMDTKADSFKVSGHAESSQAIATFMRALQASELFSEVRLIGDKEATVEGANIRQFSLSFSRTKKPDDDEKQGKKK